VAHPDESGKPSPGLKLDLFTGVITLLSALAQRRPARTGLLTSFSVFDYGACAVNISDLVQRLPLPCLASVNAGNFRTESVISQMRARGARACRWGVGQRKIRLNSINPGPIETEPGL